MDDVRAVAAGIGVMVGGADNNIFFRWGMLGTTKAKMDGNS
jgi:hypothetical protein